jgi:hypothetical protein
MTDRPRAAILSWDYRQQPDLNQLAGFVHDLSGGTLHIEQANTGSDEYAIVVTTTALPAPVVDRLYQRWSHGMLGDEDVFTI